MVIKIYIILCLYSILNCILIEDKRIIFAENIQKYIKQDTALPNDSSEFVSNSKTDITILFQGTKLSDIPKVQKKYGLSDEITNQIKAAKFSSSDNIYSKIEERISLGVGSLSDTIGAAFRDDNMVYFALIRGISTATLSIKYEKVCHESCSKFLIFFEDCDTICNTVSVPYSDKEIDIITKTIQYYSSQSLLDHVEVLKLNNDYQDYMTDGNGIYSEDGKYIAYLTDFGDLAIGPVKDISVVSPISKIELIDDGTRNYRLRGSDTTTTVRGSSQTETNDSSNSRDIRGSGTARNSTSSRGSSTSGNTTRSGGNRGSGDTTGRGSSSTTDSTTIRTSGSRESSITTGTRTSTSTRTATRTYTSRERASSSSRGATRTVARSSDVAKGAIKSKCFTSENTQTENTRSRRGVIGISSECVQYNDGNFQLINFIGNGVSGELTKDQALERMYEGRKKGEYYMIILNDGNLAIYNGDNIVWQTKTGGKGVGPFNLRLTNDRYLILEDSTGKVLYKSGVIKEYNILKRAYCNELYHDITIGILPALCKEEGNWKTLMEKSENTKEIFRCRSSSDSSDIMVSTYSDCEGQIQLGSMGWIYTKQVTGSVPLYRCLIGVNDHFVSSSETCESQKREALVGYAIPL